MISGDHPEIYINVKCLIESVFDVFRAIQELLSELQPNNKRKTDQISKIDNFFWRPRMTTSRTIVVPLLYDKSDPNEIWRFWPLSHRNNCQTWSELSLLKVLAFWSSYTHSQIESPGCSMAKNTTHNRYLR